MTGTGLPRYDGADTQLPSGDHPALTAATAVVAVLLGVALWAAGWAWNAPFTPEAGAGMFTDHHGATRAIALVITIPTLAALFGYLGHPRIGAVGLSLGFGMLWSADASITYSNVSWALGVGSMWLAVGAGTALGAWNGWMARNDRREARLLRQRWGRDL